MVVMGDAVIDNFAGKLYRIIEDNCEVDKEGKCRTPKRITVERSRGILKVWGEQEMREGFGIIQLITSDTV